ncbi:hypothetical protein [Cellulomonas sp. PS-H5]|uniref:hypothetical protein n=1 Tax=Cellulomonas sp. PS-H5 TaxID=2820400 RepID=UPI001C4F10F2|nr:hypothetical protein [Cellulomonas sp. PS-H5]MBW0252456.1 hypothetical protein [Cellulomonas sp. PS-H5]
MTQWTVDDPGAGDPDGLRVQGARLDSLTRQLAEACSVLRRHCEALGPDVWTGSAADALRSTSARHLADLTRLVDTVGPCASAMYVYAGAVQRIAEDAVLARARRDEAASDHARALRLISQYTSVPTGTVSDRSIAAQWTARDAAKERLTAAGHTLQALADERASADARLLFDLHGVAEISDWSAVGAGLTAAGVHRPSDLSAAGLRDALLDLARDILEGDSSAATLAALQSLLDACADEPALLGAFFQRLGGRGTADLVSRIGTAVVTKKIDDADGLRLAVTLQSALSAASSLWTAGRARVFARDLVGASDGAAVVGFLFGNPWTAPMGEHFTVAMADLFDRRERLGEGQWGATLASGALTLSNLQFPDRPGRGADPAGAVLQTLGNYPDAALSWLTAGGPVAGADRAGAFPRIAYWVGERVWPEADGYTAVTALWAGMQLATGGPNDPAGWTDDAWKALAEANSAFTAAFLGNPHVLPEHLCDEARINLVVAITRLLPQLREVPLQRYEDDRGPLTVTGVMPEFDAEMTLMNTTRDELAALFGLAGSSNAGLVALRRSISLLQSAMLGAAAAADSSYTPDMALRAVADLQSILDGAVEGAAEGIAVRHDARVQALIDGAVTAAGIVPLPGSGKAAEVLARAASSFLRTSVATWAGDALVDLAQDRLTAALAAGASDAWASTLNEVSGEARQPKEDLKAALAAWVVALDPEELALRGGNIEHYVQVLVASYDAVSGAAADAASQVA